MYRNHLLRQKISILNVDTTMKPYLAQHEPNPEARRNWLEKNREHYKFDHNYLAPIPILEITSFLHNDVDNFFIF